MCQYRLFLDLSSKNKWLAVATVMKSGFELTTISHTHLKKPERMQYMVTRCLLEPQAPACHCGIGPCFDWSSPMQKALPSIPNGRSMAECRAGLYAVAG